MRNGLYVTDGTKSIPLSAYPAAAWREGLGLHAGPQHETAELFARVPWLYRAVTLRAQALADLPWAVLQNQDEVVTSEEFRPVPGLEWMAGLHGLLYRLEMSLCLFGAGYWQAERNRVRTLGYRWLAAPTMEPQYDDRQGVVGFKRNLNGRTIDFDAREVVWWWLPSATAEVGPGAAPARVALAAAGVLDSMDAFGKGFFDRGAINLTLLSVEGNPPPSELEKLQAWWKRMLTGAKKAWETVAIRASVKPQVIGSPPKDLAMAELTEKTRQDITVAFGLPSSMLWSDSATFATAQQDDLNFYTKCLLPEAELVESTLNSRIFAPLGLEFAFRPERLEVFEKLESEKAFALLALVQGGVLTPNELREQMGYDPAAGGDALRVPASSVDFQSGGEMGGETAQTALTGPASAAGGRGQQNRKALELAQWQRKAIKALKDGKSPAVPFVAEAIDEDTAGAIRAGLQLAADAEGVRAAFAATPFPATRSLPGAEDGADAERATLERRHARSIKAALQVQYEAALPDDMTYEGARGAEDRVRRATEQLEAAIYAALLEAASLGVDIGRRQVESILGVGKQVEFGGVDWTLANAEAREWARNHAGNLVRGIDETTLKALRAAVADFVDGRLTFEQIKAQLASTFGAERAERIAQTEITRAYAEGNRRAWKAGGVIERMEWRTAEDERVCPQCGPLNETTANVDEGFVEGPPAHPKCRCWIVPVVEGRS